MKASSHTILLLMLPLANLVCRPFPPEQERFLGELFQSQTEDISV